LAFYDERTGESHPRREPASAVGVLASSSREDGHDGGDWARRPGCQVSDRRPDLHGVDPRNPSVDPARNGVHWLVWSHGDDCRVPATPAGDAPTAPRREQQTALFCSFFGPCNTEQSASWPHRLRLRRLSCCALTTYTILLATATMHTQK
jgi:hypothetical protein